MAPEMCNPDLDSFPGRACDVWSLGISLYAMIYNTLPFFGETEYMKMQKILKDPLELKETRNISDGLKELLFSMLDKDISQRATLEQLKQNRWLQEGKDQAQTQAEEEEQEEEIDPAQRDFPQISSVVFAKKYGLKWK